jgi:hypothetical protein
LKKRLYSQINDPEKVQAKVIEHENKNQTALSLSQEDKEDLEKEY